MIYFTFDDNNTSDLWAANILQKFNLQGIFFLNDKPDLEYQVEALLKMNQIVGNHTANHAKLTDLTGEQIYEAVVPFNDKLKKLGATGDYFSYPYSLGAYNIPIIHKTFKYIYRGYDAPTSNKYGEISRVTVTRKMPSEILEYQIPLQLHGIDTGQWYDISRSLFIDICKSKAQAI